MRVPQRGHHSQHNSTRRKFIKAVGVSSAAGLAGCVGGQTNGTDSPTVTGTSGGDLSGKEIHVLHEDDPLQDYWEKMGEKFSEETGADVKIEYMGETGAGPKERMLQLTQAGNPPELAQVTMPVAAELGARGVLADHSEMIDIFENQYGSFPEQYMVEFGGKKTFIPMVMNVHSKWYRSDVLGEVPNTWEKELEMARKHDEGEGGMRGEWLSNSSKILAPLINVFSRGWGNDAVLCQRDENNEVQVVMDEEPYRSRWIEVFEHITELAQYSPSNTGVGYTDLFNAIENGRTSQIIMYGNRGKNANNNDFVKDIRNTTWPVPSGKYQEGGRRSWGNAAGFLTFKGSNVKAAKRFVEFWSRPENFFGLFSGNPGHLAPVQPGIYEDSEFQDQISSALGPQWDFEKDVMSLFEMTQTAFDVPLETSPPNPLAGPLVGSLELGNAQVDILVNDMSIEESIDKHAKKMQEIVDDSRF